MSKFSVGERVAYYSQGLRYVGIITSIDEGGLFTVPRAGLVFCVHPKQARKLVKKKRREFWIYGDRPSNSVVCHTKPITYFGELIHVREVREKK